MKRMMVITREDLTPGQQMAQTIHAVSKYAKLFPKKFKKWNNGYVIVLTVKNERELRTLSFHVDDELVDTAEFHEPDMGYSLTAIAFIEKECTKEFTKVLPLAGNNKTIPVE